MYISARLGPKEYFFSPGAARIAQSLIDAHGGVECAAPKRSDVEKLVSREDETLILFSIER